MKPSSDAPERQAPHPDAPETDFAHLRLRAREAPTGPSVLVVHPTDQCNHGCDFCWYERSDKHITVSDVASFISSASVQLANTREVVIAGGGEPLMHPDVAQLIEIFALNLPQASLKLITNGSLLHRLSINTIRYLSYIRVSLDAIDAVAYSRNHRVHEKVFHRVLQNLEMVADAGGPTIGASFVVSKDFNASNFLEFVTRLEGMGVTQFMVKPLLSQDLQRDAGVEIPHRRHVLFSRDEFNPGVDLPSYASNFLAHVGADGYLYPCCHREGQPQWRLSHVSNAASPSSLTEESIIWRRHAENPHPCRVFDSWAQFAGPRRD